MNGGAAERVEEVAADQAEELHHSVSKGNIAVSLCMACLAAVVLASELGPAAAVCGGGLAGAASLGWSVFLGRETERMALDGDDDD